MPTFFPAVPGQATPGAFTPGDPGAAVGPLLNQWSATVANDPGLITIPVANRDGSALVAFIGWNGNTFPGQANVSVADDAHNYWQPMVATVHTLGGTSCAIWIATNADPATIVCVSANVPVSTMAVLVAEFPGLPALVQPDFAPSPFDTIGTTLGASSTATVSDWCFTILASGNNTDSITGPGGGFFNLNQVSINDPNGIGGVADLTITPAYGQFAAGTVHPFFTSSGSQGMAIGLASMKSTPSNVASSNANWPLFTVQAAFGAQPGNSQAAWTWTDISSRAIFDGSQVILDAARGRPYELTGPVSGTLQLWLDNRDGAFTPTNTSSPFYPNVLPETPVRVLATWNNEVFQVGMGFVDKWPQGFIAPQVGFTNMSASDGMGVLANLALYTAYQGEVLLDKPYSYWPLNESYGAALGLPFQNLGSAFSNTKPMIGLNGQSSTAVALGTGLTLNLQGDDGSGIGVSGATALEQTWEAGALCVDPGMPQMSSTGLGIEFIANLPTTPPQGPPVTNFTTPLVNLVGAPTNFGSGGGPVRFQVAAVSSGTGGLTYNLKVTLADFLGHSFNTSVFACPNDGASHHHFFNLTFAASTWTITHYLDGTLDTTATTSAVTTSTDLYLTVIGPALITPIADAPYNYTVGHAALYAKPLNSQRIASHATAALQGFINDTAVTRFKRIMAWSQTHLPMAATLPSPAPLMGAAFSTDGQAATDAFNDLLVSEGGWPYTDAGGTTWWASRTSFYNKQAKWVFGDNPLNTSGLGGGGGSTGPPLNGGIGLTEIPYDPAAGFDFDNQYLYTQIFATREVGQSQQITTSPTQGVNRQAFSNTGAITRVNSAAGQLAYNNRNSLQQTILTTSDQDTYDRAFWSLQKYSSSALRVPSIVVDAASNPQLWPVVLGAEQGDVVKIIRRPMGAAQYTIMGIIVELEIQVGVGEDDAMVGEATFGIVPYSIESNIIQPDVSGFNTLAGGIGW